MSDEFNATLERIDPRADKVTRSVFVGSSPQGLAATPSGVWVAARPFAAASHRGGTLTIVSDAAWARPDNGFDPTEAALGPSTTAWSPCADPAARPVSRWYQTWPALPSPAGGGTMYTFTLRRGIRYSNGTLVRASDVRRGIMRQLSFGRIPPTTKDPRRSNVPPGPAAV